MAENRRIVELDFDDVYKNFVEAMKSQEFFQGYDFAASGLSALMQQLAYDQHYSAFYGNMLYSESFTDSAQLRSSITSHAKNLAYTPRSTTAARATVRITVSARNGIDPPPTLVLDKGALFTGSNSSDTTGALPVMFMNTSAIVSTVAPGQSHVFDNVVLYQGQYRVFEWTIDETDADQQLVLPNDRIDTSLLEVYVQEGSDDTKTFRYSRVDDIVELNAESRVYFLEETASGRFRIYFGNGVFGRRVPHGKVVRAVFFETDGADGNGLNQFELTRRADNSAGSQLLDYTVHVSTVTPSAGGAPPESIESIRFAAPRSFSARKRGLTPEDWEVVIKSNFSDVSSVRVWGGEDTQKPFGNFGRVYIAINPKTGGVLSKTRKAEIQAECRRRFRIAGIEPIVVDPEHVYVATSVTVRADPANSIIDTTTLQKTVYDAIIAYSDGNLGEFGKSFEYSRFVAAIDASDPAISSTTATIEMQSRLPVYLNAVSDYMFNYQNPFRPGTIRSNQITVDGLDVYIDDDGEGRLRFYRIEGTTKRIVNSYAGTCDYNSGGIILPVRITRADPVTHDLRISCVPVSQNIFARSNKIIHIDSENVNIAVEIVR